MAKPKGRRAVDHGRRDHLLGEREERRRRRRSHDPRGAVLDSHALPGPRCTGLAADSIETAFSIAKSINTVLMTAAAVLYF